MNVIFEESQTSVLSPTFVHKLTKQLPAGNLKVAGCLYFGASKVYNIR